MLILTGVLGLLQSVILPGLLLQRIFKLRGGLCERLLRLLPLSLIANYLLIFALCALRIYKRPVLLGVILLEAAALILLYKDILRQPVSKTLSACSAAFRQEIQPLTDFLREKPENSGAVLRKWIWAVSGCLALSGVLWGFHLCRLNFGTVFSGWDTLFSWNQYAEIWVGGSIPKIGGMYPQLLPSNWSVSYLLQGENAVQFFNTLLPPVFFLMIQGVLFDLGFQRRESGFFFAAVIARYMMKKLMGDQLFDGYMDVPAAAMSLMSIYTFLKAEHRPAEEQRQAVILGLVFAAGAAVTKQSGALTLLFAPLAVWLLLRDAAKSMSKKQKWFAVGIVLIIALPWYLYCLLNVPAAGERELIADGIMSFNQTYSLDYKLRLALVTLGKYKYIFLLSLIALPFVPKKYRLLFFLLSWPLVIVWAVHYSYDARNLGPALPCISLLCGMGIAGFGEIFMRAAGRLSVGRISLAAVGLLLAAAAVFAMARFYPDGKLIEDERVLRKALFGERLNQELLYNQFGETHSGNDIYTDYPAHFLSGFENCCSAADLTDTFQVKTVLEGDKINWLLLPVVLPNNTDPSKELLEACIAEGRCEQIRCSDGYYKSYCLYQLNH